MDVGDGCWNYYDSFDKFRHQESVACGNLNGTLDFIVQLLRENRSQLKNFDR